MGYDDEIRRPLHRDDWKQREIYAHFGLAIYWCQVVETALVNYLGSPAPSHDTARIPEAEIDELFEELFGYTLGRNISNVKRLLGEKGGDSRSRRGSRASMASSTRTPQIPSRRSATHSCRYAPPASRQPS